MPDYPCRNCKNGLFRQASRIQPIKAYKFKSPVFLNATSKTQPFISFREFKERFAPPLITKSRAITGIKYYRKQSVYQGVNFKKGRFSHGIIVPYISKSIIQDSEFWIIRKSTLSRVGLDPKVDNSLEEILTSLILLWSNDKLDSSRIRIIFYRHLRFIEDDKCFDVQSYF
jgi:hypothetical protein